MKLTDFPPSIQEALCLQEAFRRLGFTSEDLYALHQNGSVFVVLQAQGKQFGSRLDHDPQVPTENALVAIWPMAVQMWNQSTEEEISTVWGPFRDSFDATGLLRALIGKGFVINNPATAAVNIKPTDPSPDMAAIIHKDLKTVGFSCGGQAVFIGQFTKEIDPETWGNALFKEWDKGDGAVQRAIDHLACEGNVFGIFREMVPADLNEGIVLKPAISE